MTSFLHIKDETVMLILIKIVDIVQHAQKPPRKLGGFSHECRRYEKGENSSKKVLTILFGRGNIQKLSEKDGANSI